ncbi:MAG: 4-alpha-glucanotransferase [Hespellia sp.]|nr:4-alpha-glucanotransferase [Hespellia sp.]
MRESGILLPISALPSKYGIGCISKEAYDFVNQLIAAGQKKWQILPLGPNGHEQGCDSPYQSYSTFAGNPYFVNLEALIEWGLLTREECDAVDFGDNENLIDYEKLNQERDAILRLAFSRFSTDWNDEYTWFVQNNGYWLEDYCLYMALKKTAGGLPWTEWEPQLRDRHPGALLEARETLDEEIRYHRFVQYMFWKEWSGLKHYANENGIQIIGDIPIYVAFDSADAWSRPMLFQFTENNEPTAVSGCPPDGFSPTGQVWNNPLYNWEYHMKTEFAWWIERMAHNLRLYDVVRIDHFRGLDEYFSIPYGDKDAFRGHWEKGPGMALFHALEEKLGRMNLIAEDLGYLTESVKELLRETGYPGMKVLEFAFDGSEDSVYLPHKYEHNSVVYTGTHDNDTLQSWYLSLNDHDREFTKRYLNNANTPLNEIHWDFIRLAMASVSELCVIPIQDYLGLGNEARINVPGVGKEGNNWKWRLGKGMITEKLTGDIWQMTKLYGRL